MASKGPKTSTDFAAHGFFAWVHTLERLRHKVAQAQGEGFSCLGGDGLPQQEAVRFIGDYGTAFQPLAATAVDQLRAQSDSKSVADKGSAESIKGAPPKMRVNFFGVAGVAGLLPLHYSRLVTERLKQKDAGLADFIDIFNHRLIALYYRAWLKYRLPYQIEQAKLLARKDPITEFLQGIVGDRAPVPMASQLYFAAHFQRRCRSAANLRAMLTELLNVPVEISQFEGHWVSLERQDRATLGPIRGRQNQMPVRLGEGILIGKRYWDASGGITVHIGPLGMEHYENWLPGRAPYRLLVELLERFVPLHIQVNLSFKVIYEAAYEKTLGGGVSLKRTAWLRRSQLDESQRASNTWIRIANYRLERNVSVTQSTAARY